MQNLFVVALILIASAASMTAQVASNKKDELYKVNAEVVKLFREAKHADALKLSERAAALTKEIHGDDSAEYALVLSNQAYIHDRLKDSKKSISAAEGTIRILKAKQVLAQESKSVLANMLELFAWQKAREVGSNPRRALQEAIEYRKKLNGEFAKQLATSYFYLGDVNYWAKDYRESVKWMTSLLELHAEIQTLSEEEFHMVYSQCECALKKVGDEAAMTELRRGYSLNSDIEPEPVRSIISGGIVNGKAMNLVKPSYPQAAKEARATGSVSIQVFISKSGRVLAACGTGKEHESLIAASEGAALLSRFSPTLLEGKPVNVRGVIVYNFTAN